MRSNAKLVKILRTIAIGSVLLTMAMPTRAFAEESKPIIKEDIYVLPEDGEYTGYIPVIPATEAEVVKDEVALRGLSERYVPENLYTDYPAIRNQNPFGSCWTFSTCSIGEFSAYSKYNKLFDASELHLLYYTYNTVTKEKYGNTVGDDTYLYISNPDDDNNQFNHGGNVEIATRTLLNWKGYAEEAQFPYFSNSGTRHQWTTHDFSEYTTENAYKDYLRVLNVYEVNLKDDRDHAKALIKEYGAISASYCHIDGVYSESFNSYYNPTNYSTNHAIAIVGWDDNFPKENFGSNKPQNNGAWLIRNNWGGNPYATGDARLENMYGYFWMSYEEGSLNVAGTNGDGSIAYGSSYAYDVIDSSDPQMYDHNYSYDGGLNNRAICFPTISWKCANVFTIENYETLKAVGLYFNDANTEYTIDLYRLNNGYKNPTDGTKLANQTFTTSYKGFYTIPLNTTQTVNAGDVVSVVVTLNAGKYMPYEGAVSWGGKFTVASPDGVSWMYGGSWSDFGKEKKANFRIKLYTNDRNIIKHNITYNLNGGVNNTSNPSKYTEGEGVGSFFAPARAGYEFLGWYVEGDDSTYITSIPTSASTNYTLCAKWKVINYEITYVLNGGTNNSSNPSTYTVEDEITLSQPTKDGYEFAGWKEDDISVKSIKKGSTGAKTFTAKWNVINYEIVYGVGVNAHNNSYNPNCYTVEDEITLKAPSYEDGTMIFVCWIDWATKKEITKIAKGSTGIKELVAKWKSAEYKITYELNGGVNSPLNPATYDNNSFITFVSPTRDYYNFDGWYEKNGDPIYAIIANRTGDLTLYARWQPIEYNITYDLDGGTNHASNPSTYTIETDDITLQAPYKENYKFLRWEDEDEVTVEKIIKGSHGDRKLIAKWISTSHVHAYTLQVAQPKYLKTAATYVSPAIYYKSCECGEADPAGTTFTYGEPLPKTDLSSCTVKLSADTYTYNGQAQTPGVTVYIGSKAVSRDACKVTYSSNINAGTAKVTVTACDGNYPVKGSTSKTFTILKAKNAITLPKKEITKTYSTKTQTVNLSASATAGTITYASNNNKVKVDGNGMVTIPKKFIGTVTITLTSAKENYETSTLKATISVVPTTPSISKVKSAKSGNLTVTWKKVTDVTGVEIQYSMDKNFGKKGLKSVTVKGTKTTAKSISKLTGNKKYYVRIRTYKTVSGKKLYSAWSKVKNIKIKK